MRLGTMIGDAAESIPFVEAVASRARLACRALKFGGRGRRVGVRPAAYAKWVLKHDTPSPRDVAALRASVASFSATPTISVVMPVFNPDPRVLEEAIRSVRAQAYERWELCIADDVSTRRSVRAVLERSAAADPRITVRFRPARGNISAASNTALAMTTGEFVALLDHDDVLPPHALYWVAEAINRHSDAALLYSDEDKITVHGRRFDPYFKCDFNHELLLAQNMISHLGVYRRDLIVGLGGFRSEFDGSQDHDLALRVAAAVPRSRIVHIPRILYHWRAVPGSTAGSIREKPACPDSGRRAVADHLHRLGRGGAVEPAPDVPHYNRVRHPLPEPRPRVSIVICTRDRAPLLRAAVTSITSLSTYGNLEILVVDNGSQEPGTRDCLAALARDPRVTVVRDDSAFNYSRLNNAAVARTSGEIVCLLNNDVVVHTPGWLEELVSHAIRPGVGAVGARLWYPNGKLQHGGVIIGIGGVANHAHLGLRRGESGYFGRAVLAQEVSAVTGACLAVRRPVFDEVGGLDERLAVAFNDVDFCLRLRRAGYRNIWTPHAELVHHESASRGVDDSPEKIARFHREVRFMEARWGEVLAGDPHYNPNLSLVAGDYSLAVSRDGTIGTRMMPRAG